jgi:hypothetical protein
MTVVVHRSSKNYATTVCNTHILHKILSAIFVGFPLPLVYFHSLKNYKPTKATRFTDLSEKMLPKMGIKSQASHPLVHVNMEILRCPVTGPVWPRGFQEV